MELLFSAGKIALGVAIGLALLLYFLQDRMLFYPRPLSASQRAELKGRFAAVEEIFLDVENQKIHAWHVNAGAGTPLVLYFGGNAEDVSWMIGDALARAPGVSWLLVDYRGYGASGGSPSEKVLVADALRWYDSVSAKTKRIFVFGRSLGSGVAVQLAAERPLAGVVLVTPYDSLVEVAKRIYPFLPVSLLMKNRFESILLAPRMTAPLLCLVAEQDQIIPPEHARRLYEAWAGPKRWVALSGAGHNSTDSVPAFWRSIRPFLEGRHGPG